MRRERPFLCFPRHQSFGEGPYVGHSQTRSGYIFDLSDEEIGAMQVFAKHVAEAIKKAFPCIKVGQAVLGLEVPHAHIHLIPMQNEKDMLFSNPKLTFTDEEFKAIAKAISDNYMAGIR